jgi:hypothetical protein
MGLGLRVKRVFILVLKNIYPPPLENYIFPCALFTLILPSCIYFTLILSIFSFSFPFAWFSFLFFVFSFPFLRFSFPLLRFSFTFFPLFSSLFIFFPPSDIGRYPLGGVYLLWG